MVKPIEENGRNRPEFSTNGKAQSQDLPGERHHIVFQMSSGFDVSVSTVLAVIGAAIGTGAVLETSLFPAPISASLNCALCDEVGDRIKLAAEAITQPLRDEQDKNLRRLGEVGAKAVRDQIRKVATDREAYFDDSIVRSPADEAGFNRRIRALRHLLQPTLIVENRIPGSLYDAVASSGGAHTSTTESEESTAVEGTGVESTEDASGESAAAEDASGVEGHEESSESTDSEDVTELADALDLDSSAAILVFEHTWAKPLRDAIVGAGGVLAANFRVPGLVVDELMKDLAELD